MGESDPQRKTYKPLLFFLIVFVLSWGARWLQVIAMSRGWFGSSFLLLAIAGISPAAAAVILIFSSGNRELRRDFRRRLLKPGPALLRLFPIILLFVPVLMILSVLISLGFGGSLSQLKPSPGLLAFPVPLAFYFAVMLPQTVIMNRLYFRTDRTILTAIIFHFTINFMGEAFSIQQQTKVIAAVLFFTAAICVIVVEGDLFFSKDRISNAPFEGKIGLSADYSNSQR